MRKTIYCQNIGPKHLRDTNSPSKHYCNECYGKLKAKYDLIEAQGGPIEGLRGARVLAGGSFGYEQSQNDKERNLHAFFHYVMPHIPEEKAHALSKEISKNGRVDFCTKDGIKRAKLF